jgi:hypothetical protein
MAMPSPLVTCAGVSEGATIEAQPLASPGLKSEGASDAKPVNLATTPEVAIDSSNPTATTAAGAAAAADESAGEQLATKLEVDAPCEVKTEGAVQKLDVDAAVAQLEAEVAGNLPS